MRNVDIGDFVETIHGINGVLTEVRRGYSDAVVFIATSDMRTFYCPVTDLKDCIYIGQIKEPVKA